MDEKNLAEKILEKIKVENIEPKPRWHFLLKNYVVWISGALALIFGSAGMSVVIYLLKYNDWEMGGRADSGFLGFFLLTLPYFWLVFLAIFAFVLYYNIKHSKRGYRYPAGFIVAIALLSSVILGEGFFLAGLGEKIDEVLGSKAPLYREMFNPQLDFWFNPEQGRLSGLLIASPEGVFLSDISGQTWNISFADSFVADPVIFSGRPVNMMGKIVSDNAFEVVFIKPARPGRAFMIRSVRDMERGRGCPDFMPCPLHDFR